MEGTPGVPAESPPEPSVQQAMNAVSGPATALAIIGVFGALGAFASAFAGTVLFSGLRELAWDEDRRRQIDQSLAHGTGNSGFPWVMLAVSAFVVFGAIEMKRLKSYGLAMAGALLALLPLVGPCCCLGVPFGVWGVMVLLKPEVKAGFEAAARGAAR